MCELAREPEEMPRWGIFRGNEHTHTHTHTHTLPTFLLPLYVASCTTPNCPLPNSRPMVKSLTSSSHLSCARPAVGGVCRSLIVFRRRVTKPECKLSKRERERERERERVCVCMRVRDRLSTSDAPPLLSLWYSTREGMSGKRWRSLIKNSSLAFLM
jgi:hypothetical protein